MEINKTHMENSNRENSSERIVQNKMFETVSNDKKNLYERYTNYIEYHFPLFKLQQKHYPILRTKKVLFRTGKVHSQNFLLHRR